jgi:hypothetical protein
MEEKPVHVDFSFDEARCELNCTLSVLLTSLSAVTKNRIKEIQTECLSAFESDFPAVAKLKTKEDLKSWMRKPSERRVYACEDDTIHFSMLNCLYFRLDRCDDFSSRLERVENTGWFDKLKGEIREKLWQPLRDAQERFEIRGIYAQNAPPSIALQIFPVCDLWLPIIRRFNRRLDEFLTGLYVSPQDVAQDEKTRLKIYCEGESYFAINILRFLRSYECEPCGRFEALAAKVQNHNLGRGENRITLEGLEPKLLFSDAYLAQSTVIL